MLTCYGAKLAENLGTVYNVTSRC